MCIYHFHFNYISAFNNKTKKKKKNHLKLFTQFTILSFKTCISFIKFKIEAVFLNEQYMIKTKNSKVIYSYLSLF